MTKIRRDFTPEFKREAVALLESSGRPLMQIATELGIFPSMLKNWRAIAHGAAPRSRAASSPTPTGPAPVTSPADHAAEIARLRRELNRTRMERDILKNLWTGRALQEGCGRLDEGRFASIYPASGWSLSSGPSWESARTRPA